MPLLPPDPAVFLVEDDPLIHQRTLLCALLVCYDLLWRGREIKKTYRGHIWLSSQLCCPHPLQPPRQLSEY